MLKSAAAVLASLCSLPSFSVAQVSDAQSAWTLVSSNLVAAAARFPESDYGFRPSSDVRSFAQLIGHVSDANLAFCAPLVPDAKPSFGADKLTTKSELLAALKNSVAFCTMAASRMSDADAAQQVKLFGRDRAKLTALWGNISHANEHYGNVVTYLRLKGIVPPSSDPVALGTRLYYDKAHGQTGPEPELAEISSRVRFQITADAQPLTPEALKNVRALYLRAPSKQFSAVERDAVIEFVKNGGALLVVVDEEKRQSLASTGVNDLLQPFGMNLTADTPYLHNTGAIARAGEINASDREIPYSGGRAVEGGTPFAFQLNMEGKPAQPFAAYHKVENGGRIVVMGEGMASIFLGTKDGERLSGPPRDAMNTRYWGKDSAVFMEEVLTWLLKK